MTKKSDNTDTVSGPFDNLSALRLDQSYADTVGVKKLLTTVPVRKPGRQDFVRVHPDPKYRLTPAAIIEVKEDREVYLVTSEMAPGLHGRILVGNAVPHDQSARCDPPVAREAPRSRWQAKRMESFGG